MKLWKKIAYTLLFAGIFFIAGILFNKCGQNLVLKTKETTEISQIDQLILDLDELLKYTPKEIAKKESRVIGELEKYAEGVLRPLETFAETEQEYINQINKKIKQLETNFSITSRMIGSEGAPALSRRQKLTTGEIRHQMQTLYDQDTTQLNEDAYEQWDKHVLKILREQEKVFSIMIRHSPLGSVEFLS